MHRSGAQPQCAGSQQPIFPQRWFWAQVRGGYEVARGGSVKASDRLCSGKFCELGRQGGIRADGRRRSVRERGGACTEPGRRTVQSRPPAWAQAEVYGGPRHGIREPHLADALAVRLGQQAGRLCLSQRVSGGRCTGQRRRQRERAVFAQYCNR